MSRLEILKRIGKVQDQLRRFPVHPGMGSSGAAELKTVELWAMTDVGTLVVAVDFECPIVGGIHPHFLGSLRYSHADFFRAPCRPFAVATKRCGSGVGFSGSNSRRAMRAQRRGICAQRKP